jgi:hypothetical protein
VAAVQAVGTSWDCCWAVEGSGWGCGKWCMYYHLLIIDTCAATHLIIFEQSSVLTLQGAAGTSSLR